MPASVPDSNALRRQHQWSPGGVSGYPLTHPIVGQGEFFQTFQHFIHVVEHDQEGFVQVFATVAPWGVGKSRLGYELIGQINDAARGWFTRQAGGGIADSGLFRDAPDRDKYLGLFIRYTQIANEHQNTDNWFGYGLYKALLPLAKEEFDGSIQGNIAKEAYDRLFGLGFEKDKLAAALQLSAGHTPEKLYGDKTLVTRLCEAAYAYLKTFGIEYVVVVLDELETITESVTFGQEEGDLRRLDGAAIKLIARAIKEEDPRHKLPWLRYVALCSPAIGDELREVQSTARRFELVDLSRNAFADVSDFVRKLREEGRLAQEYPTGVVEAAYAMSGGNFGWFNVIMSSVDQVLRDLGGEATLGRIFSECVAKSARVKTHVLDHTVLRGIDVPAGQRALVEEFLYGQLPRPLSAWTDEQRELLTKANNEYGEEISEYFQRVEWTEDQCAQALRDGRFQREKDRWKLGGIDQLLDLQQLLANLGTYAIHETKGQPPQAGRHVLLVPLAQRDFCDLVAMLYPHPAVEDAARALWRIFFHNTTDFPPERATHLGPSGSMLQRLNLRLRRDNAQTQVLRDTEANTALEAALLAGKAQSENDRARQILTGGMRVLDDHWEYEPATPALRGDFVAIETAGGTKKGLLRADWLKLHPEGRAVLAWVRNIEEYEKLCDAVAAQFDKLGRTPLVVFTSSRALADQIASASSTKIRDSRSFATVFQLSPREETMLHQVGLPRAKWNGFVLGSGQFTTAFHTRSQSFYRLLKDHVGNWREALDKLGRIAWPFRPGGALREDDRDQLLRAWRWMFLDAETRRTLAQADEHCGFKVEEIIELLRRMESTPTARSSYRAEERAGLFDRLNEGAEPQLPAFVAALVKHLFAGRRWSLDTAEREWFWGYAFEPQFRKKDVFGNWMALLCEMAFARLDPTVGDNEKRYCLINREHLAGDRQAAENWLNNDYTKIVNEQLVVVFGNDRVRTLFGPTGVKTLGARDRLDRAKESLEKLVTLEGKYGTESDPVQYAELLRNGARLRLEVQKAVDWVYRAERFRELRPDDNLKTLNFENDAAPLWERIGKAALFADQVKKQRDQIVGRIEELKQTIEDETRALTAFPRPLFTRPLEKIRNILDGALVETPGESGTQRKQHEEPGTLRYHLQNLDVARATEKLDALAREVGLDGGTPKPLAEISGQLASGYREFRSTFEKVESDLENQTLRIQSIDAQMQDAPADFQPPENWGSIKARPGIIADDLTEELPGEAERLLQEFDAPAKLGNFQPLMQEARKLLESPKASLGALGGDVLTAENKLAAYREQLLAESEVNAVIPAINAIERVIGRPQTATVSAADLAAKPTLKEAKEFVLRRAADCRRDGNAALAVTGVTFERWSETFDLLGRQQEPTLSSGEAEALVRNGFLRRTYALGGPAV